MTTGTLPRWALASIGLLAVGGCEVPDPTPSQRIPDVQAPMIKTLDDVKYGASPAQRLDLYEPPEQNGGVVVWLHGGGWADRPDDLASLASEERSGMQAVVGALYLRGWTVASVGYTDVAEAPLPQQVYDVKLAIRWIRRHAVSLGVSPGSVVVMGWSAGGHLAALTGTSAGSLEPPDVVPTSRSISSRPDAVVSIQGVLDPATFAEISGVFDSNPAAMAAALGCPGRPAEWRTCNPALLDSVRPAAYLDAEDPPVYIVAGDRDGIVELRSQALAPAAEFARTLGVDRVLLDVVDTGEPSDHGGLDPRNHSQAVSFELNAAALFRFVDAVLPTVGPRSGPAGGRSVSTR